MSEEVKVGENNRAALYLLVAAAQISHFGTQISVVAIPWYVIAETGDPVVTAFTGFAVLAPVFFAGLVMGASADRFGVLALCIGCDLVAAAGTLLVPVFDPAGTWSMAGLLVMLFVASFSGLTSAYSCRLLISSVATRASVRLETANSLYFTAQRVALIFGPLLAAAILPWTGPRVLILVDGLSFVLSAALMAVARVTHRAVLADVSAPRQAKGDGWLLSGLTWLARHRQLRLLATASSGVNATVRVVTLVLLPIYVYALGDVRLLGPLATAFGIGLLVGGIATSPAHRLLTGPRLLVVAQVFMCTGMTVFVLAEPGPVISGGCLVLAGLGGGLMGPTATTLLDRQVPDDLRNRVFGAWQWAVSIIGPLLVLVAGPAHDALGTSGVAWGVTLVLAGTLLATVLAATLSGQDELNERNSSRA